MINVSIANIDLRYEAGNILLIPINYKKLLLKSCKLLIVQFFSSYNIYVLRYIQNESADGRMFKRLIL